MANPSPAPSYLCTASWSRASGIFYVGETPTIPLNRASGPTAYEVRDYYGTVVSSGAMSGGTCTPTAPAGGWKPGWYRVYWTGPSSDVSFGNSYGATSFVVLRDDPRFPPIPAPSAVLGYGGEVAVPSIKGLLGIGTSRHIIADVTNMYATTGGAATDSIAACQSQAAASRAWWSQPDHPAYVDAARPRPLWASTPSAVADALYLPRSSSGIWASVYPASAGVDGASVFVSLGAGTSSGAKVSVYSPDSATMVETWDNLAADAQTVVNGGSAYIRLFGGGASPGTLSPTAIGTKCRDGVIDWVTKLYAAGVTRFEFTNEPQAGVAAELAHCERLFVGSVHAGNPNAKAIGPCFVSINGNAATAGVPLWRWNNYLNAGGCQWYDEISTHDYGTLGCADLPSSRIVIGAWLDLLSKAGLSGKPIWQTETAGMFTSVYGIHHPRRDRAHLLHVLLWEQYGVARERNPFWYDRSHGFWSFPSWWMNGDSSLTPVAPLMRTLCEETFGLTHQTALNLGPIAGQFALGSVYAGSSGKVVVAQMASAMPGATLTLSVTGASGNLTVVDGFGNTSTAAIDANGRVTMPLAEVPTYLRLPTGASAAVWTVNDWPPLGQRGQGISSGPKAIGSTPSTLRPTLADGDPSSGWDGVTGETMPSSATLVWPVAQRGDRVVIWAGNAFQNGSTLVDFDVQTSLDGSTWTTRATVTKPQPASIWHGTTSTNVWAKYETFWDEQWVFDIPFSAAAYFTHLRLLVRDVSYGGEPDLQSVSYGGQGNPTKQLTLREVAVLCDVNTRPQIVRGA